MRFVSRLFKLYVLAGCAAIAFGVFAGSTIAHNALYDSISREYSLDREQWERWIGINTQSVIPYATVGAEICFLFVMALMPDRNERSAIKRYIRKRLANPAEISESELQVWVRISHEVNDDDYL